MRCDMGKTGVLMISVKYFVCLIGKDTTDIFKFVHRLKDCMNLERKRIS